MKEEVVSQSVERTPLELGADLKDDDYPGKITNLTAKRNSKGYYIEFEVVILVQGEETRAVYKQHNVSSEKSLELLRDDLKNINFTLFTPLELALYSKILIDKAVVVRKKTKGEYINWYFVKCGEEYRAELIYNRTHELGPEEEMAPNAFPPEEAVDTFEWSFS